MHLDRLHSRRYRLAEEVANPEEEEEDWGVMPTGGVEAMGSKTEMEVGEARRRDGRELSLSREVEEAKA